MLGGGWERGVTIAGPESGEVRGGIVEAVAKMFGSLESDRFFWYGRERSET